MIQEKVVKILQLIVGVAKYCRVSMSMRCPKFRFPIWVIVIDELELISFVSQGLTLSTASLVISLKSLECFITKHKAQSRKFSERMKI